MHRLLWFVCLALAAPPWAIAAQPNAPASLPDAPTPAVSTSSSIQADSSATQPAAAGEAARYAPIYARTIFPGETARPLTVREKYIYAGRQMVEPINFLPALFSAGEGQYRNSDPRYGTDAGAFGQRLGAALVREDSDRLFTNAVFPALLHEDPRYFRMGTGSDVRRVEYALGQVFIARTDSGKSIPNYAGLLGRGIAAGLTQAYYPDTSRGGGVVLRGFGYSLGGLAVFNILREFVPRDVFTHLTVFRHS